MTAHMTTAVGRLRKARPLHGITRPATVRPS
jgi:hypothetical protein